MQNETPDLSPRAVVLGLAAFVLVTLGLLALIEAIGIERIQAAIAQAGPLAPLAYMALKAATYVFAPLSSGPIQLSSGLLFGPFWGILYTIIGEVIGGSISFLIARHLGRPAVQRFVGDKGLARVDRFVSQLGGWKALAYARLFLAALYDFISYAAGFAGAITLRQYVLVSFFVGLIPTALFVLAGASLAGDRSLLVIIYVLIGALTLVPVLLNRWLRRRAGARSGEGANS